MALGFLADAAKSVAPYAGQIGTFLDAIGIGRPKVKYGPTASEQQAMSLLLALQDPNNSLIKSNTQANLQKGMEDFLMQLKQMQMLDARRLQRGNRSTFFQPERADETIDYLTSRGMPAIAEQARQTAKQDIGRQIDVLRGNVPTEVARQNAQNYEKQQRYGAFQTSGGFGGNIQKILSAIYNPNQLPWLEP